MKNKMVKIIIIKAHFYVRSLSYIFHTYSGNIFGFDFIEYENWFGELD
jgi:hypothetical protein